MISIVKLKRCMVNVSIFDVIINELCHKKKLCLIILFKVDKESKASFYCTILSLTPAICLWIKDDGESLLDA